jgi:hypothetical protein
MTSSEIRVLNRPGLFGVWGVRALWYVYVVEFEFGGNRGLPRFVRG